jgi:hypothetical protein
MAGFAGADPIRVVGLMGVLVVPKDAALPTRPANSPARWARERRPRRPPGAAGSNVRPKSWVF